ncbi:MAG: response regulator [Bacteroidales bacterium]|nr:response regulator [Bacteroidales bacterium]
MKKYNFLIVDDIFINRLLLKEIIQDLCGVIKEAANGKEAIDIIQNEDIDIILMDIEMPVMNGIETTKYIRTMMSSPKNKLPIIALTAHNPDDFFESYSDAGFNQLLTKPYSFNKIINAIESFCA